MNSCLDLPLKPYPVTAPDGTLIKPGDIMKNDPHGRGMMRRRDDYLGYTGFERSRRKEWHDQFAAERFEVTETGHNSYCPVIRYRKLNSGIIGEVMAHELVPA
jgi:hypothetical protein